MIRHRAKVFLVLGFAVGLLTGLLLSGAGPVAHARTLPPGTCSVYVYVDGIVTGVRTPARRRLVLRRCAAAVRIEHATDRCLRVRGSVLGRGVCDGLVRAGDRRGKLAWSWDPKLHELLRRESSGNPNAINDTSGACGLFQRLQMMPPADRPCPWDTSGRGTSRERVYSTPLVQSVDGLRYIAGRYGTPAAALQHHDDYGWY